MRSKILVTILLFCSLRGMADAIHEIIEVKWNLIDTETGKANPIARLTIYNPTANPIACKDWSIWFNYMRRIDPASVDKRFSIIHKNGDLYRLGFEDPNLYIPAKGKLEINYTTKGLVPNFTDVPSGLYVLDEKSNQANNIAHYTIDTDILSPLQKKTKLAEQYDHNTFNLGGVKQLLIPTPTQIELNKGRGFSLSSVTALKYAPQFEQEATKFRSFIKATFNIDLNKSNAGQNLISFVLDTKLGTEAYSLKIKSDEIEIRAADPQGAFYAIQSIKSLLTAGHWKETATLILPDLTINDSPRFKYRGASIDVARNFHDKTAIKRIIDVMALYKLNTLHLHLIDDEGWRLEIKSIPELTEVGSKRSATFSTGLSLQPSYGSGAVAAENNYYSEDDFIEILKYAKDNYVEVVTEIETPGHSRAAIKSMQARYQKYMGLGNREEAERFLLNDPLDTSVYSSAQYWNDNVMNVAMPSTYRFISEVIDNIQQMYKKAGVEMKQIHLGGDEVPRGSWENSPKIKGLMESLNLKTVYEVWPYYINKVADLCKEKGLVMAGWEEMGMANDGKGMKVNPALGNKGIRLDVWNNIVGGGQEDLAYKLANAGYEVVYTSASNLYFDLAWKNTFDEPGHTWAGFIDLYKAYSFLPTNFFLNVTDDGKGKKIVPSFFDKKERLTATGKQNIIGIKSGAWSEKILTTDRQDYMLYPRLLALAERAWAKETIWEKTNRFDKATFDKEYRAFVAKVGEDELQKLNIINGGYYYRLPKIGLKLAEGKLLLNTEYPGFDVFYTDNGEEPDLKSKKVGQSLAYDIKKTYKFRVITAGGRMGEVVSF